jgi:DNA topoisomerase-1
MPKHLLIVESPAKARTIKKYLGPDYRIMASVGHLKDLPVKSLGVDIEQGFEPKYVTIKGKGKILKELKAAGKKSEAIYLAPDPDREGEAIAWHIAEEMKNGDHKIYRVLFNELTPRAIREALASPQALNQARFESQQARRILDRLVGYQISPLLWSKVKRGLSAGRVQSVSVKMICDREREIQAFEAREYWSLTAHLSSKEPPPFRAKLSAFEGKKIELKDEDQTLKIAAHVKGQTFTVSKVLKKKKKKNPSPPFTTSLLQQRRPCPLPRPFTKACNWGTRAR